MDIHNAKRQRLAALEVRAARYGFDVPPEVANEIAELRRDLHLTNDRPGGFCIIILGGDMSDNEELIRIILDLVAAGRRPRQPRRQSPPPAVRKSRGKRKGQTG